MITKPVPGEKSHLYMAVSMGAVSTVLIRKEVKVQQPINFVSHALSKAELKYPIVEKAAYSVLLANRKLWPYFDT